MGDLARIDGGRDTGLGLPAVTAPPSPGEWQAMKQQAEVIAKSGLAPKSVSTPDKILVIAMKARELALPPMQGLSHIHIVEGRPALSAELMVALVQRAGHKLRVLETSSRKCVVEGVRADDPRHPSRVEWTMEDAKTAGVANKGPWKSYPAAMLRARAISALCRFAFADVLMGASYVPEELGAEVNEEGEVLSVPDRDEPAEDAKVVEEEDREKHSEVLVEVEELLKAVSDATVPNKEQARAYARESYDKARVIRQRLRRKLEEEQASEEAAGEADTPEEEFGPPEEEIVPDFGDLRGAARNANPPQKARKSQVDLIRTLVEELHGEEGAGHLEKRIGKTLAELTRAEADELIDEMTPEEGR